MQKSTLLKKGGLSAFYFIEMKCTGPADCKKTLDICLR